MFQLQIKLEIALFSRLVHFKSIVLEKISLPSVFVQLLLHPIGYFILCYFIFLKQIKFSTHLLQKKTIAVIFLSLHFMFHDPCLP